MLAHTKKHPIDSERLEARFVGSRDKIAELREVGESLTIAEVFPEYGINPLGAALRGARSREGLTQRQLAEALHVADYRAFL